MTPVVVVGVPGDRRVRLFGEALVRGGHAVPLVVAWRQVLTEGMPPLPPGALVRVESPGEDAATGALLRGPGPATRAGGGRAWYLAFLRALDTVRRAVAATPGARLLGDVAEIGVLFDKRRCHALLAGAGVPVPPALPGPVGGYADLRAGMAAAGWNRVFVKPAHGSSASGVLAFQAAGARLKATTSVELDSSGELHNSLRVRSYTGEREVAAIVDALAPEGLHVERWFPKASLGGRVVDLRVVVVGGVPTHAVVRSSASPMTNLHLGGSRGDLAAFRAALGPERWARALRVCARAAACFPAAPSVGVDLMAGSDLRRFAVAEVNAFGDLLPGLTGLPGSGAEGLDTYDAQVARLPGAEVSCSPNAEVVCSPGAEVMCGT
ncbi:STM4014 family protein [Nonomuraea typhae]|uniref:STM4014 family protein n=1 Tax=Nonomuraea typhae TaxID=2603600 RepID=UPI001CA48B03|nr:STM4014 family protein [Nonomuraea typhae]